MTKGAKIGIGIGAVALVGGVVFFLTRKKNSDQLELVNNSQAGQTKSQNTNTEDVSKDVSQDDTSEDSMDDNDQITVGDNWKDNKRDVVGKWKGNKGDIKASCGKRPILGKKKKQAWAECVAKYSGFSGFDGGFCHNEVCDILNDL